MPRTYVLERRQFIPRPVDEVFDFFGDAGNLETITPPWLNFRILTPRPIDLHEGTLIDYRLRVCGVPIYWRTIIESFDPGKQFVDRQLRGPYKLWRHLHVFEPFQGGTRMLDRVEYQMPFGPLGTLTHAILTTRQLKAIFDFRAETIDRLFAAPAVAVD